MSKLNIVEHPNDILRKQCKSIKGLAPSKKIKQMLDLMYESNGMGLAAPQVGWNARVFVMNITRDRSQELVFINPTIVSASKEKIEMPEGCLSFPGMVGLVERPMWVKILAQDLSGQHFYFDDEEWGSRCAQHEIDHLNGILLIDRTQKLYKGEDPL